MSAAPHPSVSGLWRAGGAPAAAMRALAEAERGLGVLLAEVAAPEDGALAVLLDPVGDEDAVARALARLRVAAPPGEDAAGAARPQPAPVASQAAMHPSPTSPDGSRSGTDGATRPEPGMSAMRAVPGLRIEATGRKAEFLHAAGQETASMDATRRKVASMTDAAAAMASRRSVPGATPVPITLAVEGSAVLEAAARRAVGTAAPREAARQAVALLLEGLRPTEGSLLAAVGVTPSPAAPPASVDPIGAMLTRALARFDTARTMAARGAEVVPEPEGSGFRRLAARFAPPPRPPRREIEEAATHPVPPWSPTPAASGPEAPVLPVPRPATAAAGGDAEMAEQLARILRREARRQGIADEGGVG
jgi:hypothetical protein